MNVVNPNETTHKFIIIPRFYPTEDIVFNLYNEANQNNETIENVYGVVDGEMIIEFNYEFIEGDRFQIKITEGSNVVYRGKLFATSQTPQDYSTTTNAYYY